jgi:hypothetical protein
MAKKGPGQTGSSFDFRALVQAFQGQFDTIGFKTHHHVTTYGYDGDPQGTARYISHLLKGCLVFRHVIGSERNPLLGKELLCLFTVGSSGAGIYLHFFAHGNLLKLKKENLQTPIVLFFLKLVLCGTAYRTGPVRRQVFKLRTRIDPIIGIPIRRIIHITTY